MDMWRKDRNKHHDSQTTNDEKIVSESEDSSKLMLGK